MLRIIVDSGSSIKPEEKEKYGVDIIPLKVLFNEEEYLDCYTIDIPTFYKKLVDENIFPKTSLPPLGDAEKLVNNYLSNGDRCVILTISSGISGTYNAFKMMFEGNENVLVIDTQSAVGGIKILVNEINRNKDKSLKEIEEIVNDIIPRINIMAIPETLDYLQKGGRLSKKDWIVGSILKIKPVIGVLHKKVHVYAKRPGLKRGMDFIIESLKKMKPDKRHGIVAEYSFNQENLNNLIERTPQEFKDLIIDYDNIDPAIACHWGPNAFGYVFVKEK